MGFTTFYVACFLASLASVLLIWLFRFTSPIQWASHQIQVQREKHLQIIALLLITPFLFRIAIIPLWSLPFPKVADEFGHLLVADTLLEGRLSNPVPKYPEFFESNYVLLEPAYASIYPIGQGAVLALGQLLFGVEWAGVWLMGFACWAAVLWALLGWLPLYWAYTGLVIAISLFGPLSGWMNSYWGGSLFAFCGALVFGSLPRLFGSGRARYAWVAALGLGSGFLVRPFEALTVAIAVGIWLLVWFVRSDKAGAWRLLAPFCVVPAIIAGVTVAHNNSVSGHPFRLPYLLSQIEHGVPQSLLFQAPIPEPPDLSESQISLYRWQHQARSQKSGLAGYLRSLRDVTSQFVTSYLAWILLPAWLIFTSARPPRSILALMAITTASLLVSALYPMYYPHYSAVLLLPVLVISVEALRRVAALHVRSFPAGGIWVAVCLLILAIGSIKPLVARLRYVEFSQVPGRVIFDRDLRRQGGTHLVFVRYSSRHSLHDEWIYNDAEIESSPVVWARDLGPERNETLIRDLPGRRIWHIEADQRPARLVEYSRAHSQISRARSLAERNQAARPPR